MFLAFQTAGSFKTKVCTNLTDRDTEIYTGGDLILWEYVSSADWEMLVGFDGGMDRAKNMAIPE